MARIFISYKRVDKEKVFRIKDQIESALGEKCWIDLDGIESDAQFKNVIIRAINACEIVLFMYSKAHSKIVDFEKDWTVRELNFASKKKKRIVFINLDGSPLTDAFEFDYGTKQQVDASSEERVLKLLYDLRNWMGINYKESNSSNFVFNEKKNNVTEIKYVSRPHNTIEAQLPTAINGRSIRSLYVSTAPTTLGYGKNKMNELEDRYSQAEQLSKQGKFEEAFKLYLETADAGHPDAMGTVGWYYKKGQGVAQNEGLWIQYTDWAIQSKEYWRAYQLGKDLLERDYYEDAFFYLEIAYNNLEKTNGYFEETAYLLGECYQYGYGVEINLAKAIECYRESVKRSFGSAEYSDAGKALKKLNVPFTDVSPSDFVDATPRMVNGKSPKELYNMGKDSEEGRGFELKNLVKAYAYFKASAERCYGLALVKMGDIYAGKDGYPFQDSKLSKDYYERGITQLIKESDDDGYICCELYHIYNRGHGTTKDVEKAEFYAKKGTTLDYIYCYRYYAEILEGKGMLEEAFQNMRIAAEKGDGMAQYSVALMYLNGVGTISDKEKGIAMLLKAAKNHYSSAHDAQWKLREYGINVDTEF